MSQPDATLYIQPPMFETTVAVQITANVRLRNGAHADTAAGAGEGIGGLFVRAGVILVVQAYGEFMLTRKKAPRVSLPEIVAIRVGRGKSGATTWPGASPLHGQSRPVCACSTRDHADVGARSTEVIANTATKSTPVIPSDSCFR